MATGQRPRLPRKSTGASFKHAADGLVHAFRTQRHLPHYFIAIIIALIAGVYLRVSNTELMFVFSAIMFVLVAEMLNTAIESVVDMVSAILIAATERPGMMQRDDTPTRQFRGIHLRAKKRANTD